MSNKMKRVGKGRKVFWTVVLLVVFPIFFLTLIWLGSQIESLRRMLAAENSWVDNDRNLIKNSAWFTTHAYRDCAATSGGFWLTDPVDCLFDEPAQAPSAVDQIAAQDPAGLYYKHFLPTDFYSTLPGFFDAIDISNLNQNTIAMELQRIVEANPGVYANISLGSLVLGLEGGNAGTVARTASFFVHPVLERPIANTIGVLQRATNLYKPFIEGATGSTVSNEDLEALYTAALNRCGGAALNNDQSGKGVFKVVGEYAVIVQGGDDTTSGELTITNDCHIHVVASSVCGGSNMCPSPTQGIPPTATPTPSDVITQVPSVVPTVNPTLVPTLTGSPGGEGDNQGFLRQLLELIKLIIEFLLGLLGVRR